MQTSHLVFTRWATSRSTSPCRYMCASSHLQPWCAFNSLPSNACSWHSHVVFQYQIRSTTLSESYSGAAPPPRSASDILFSSMAARPLAELSGGGLLKTASSPAKPIVPRPPEPQNSSPTPRPENVSPSKADPRGPQSNSEIPAVHLRLILTLLQLIYEKKSVQSR